MPIPDYTFTGNIKYVALIRAYYQGHYKFVVPLLNVEILSHCETCGHSFSMDEAIENIKALLSHRAHKTICPYCGETERISSRPWSIREKREIRTEELSEQFVEELKREHEEFKGIEEWRRARFEPLLDGVR